MITVSTGADFLICKKEYKRLIKLSKSGKSFFVIGKAVNGRYVALKVIQIKNLNNESLLQKIIASVNDELEDHVEIIARSENENLTIQAPLLVKFSGDEVRILQSDGSAVYEIVFIDPRIKDVDPPDVPKDLPYYEEILEYITSHKTAVEIEKRFKKKEVEEERTTKTIIVKAVTKAITYLIVPFIVLASIIVMPFRMFFGKKFRIKGKTFSLKDSFTFFEGIYNLLLSIEAIPEAIVRHRFQIKRTKRKLDITERGRSPDYVINKYVTQIIDNSLGIVAGFYIVQRLDDFEQGTFSFISWLKDIFLRIANYGYAFLEQHETLKFYLLSIWNFLYYQAQYLALLFSELWINYLVYLFQFVFDFLREHPISLAAVILILAGSGISGLLNAAADVLTVLILPIKLIYKILQLAHAGIIALGRKIIHSRTSIKVVGAVLYLPLLLIYAPFFILYFVLGIIVLVVELIRSLFRGTARIFDAMPLYKTFVWLTNKAPGIPVLKTENKNGAVKVISIKKQGPSYIIEEYIDSFKEWWTRNNPKLVIMRFIYGRIKEPKLPTPELEELTAKERLILLKAALGFGTLNESIIKKLQT